jgi:hypothetical protein
MAADLTGLSSHLDVLVTMEDTVLHKPDPEPLLLAVNRLGATPTGAVYVGDAIVDVQAARNAGMAAVAVTWGAGVREQLEAMAPNIVAETVDDLREALLPTRQQTQAADSPREIAKPITTSGPVKTFSTLYASGSSVSASIANSAPAANASISAPVRPPAGSSTA